MTNAETGSLPPAAPRRGPPRRLPVHRRGVRPRRDRGTTARGRQRGDASSASRSPRSTRWCASGRSAPPPPSLSTRSSPARTTITRAVRLMLESVYPIVQGYKDSVGCRRPGELLRSRPALPRAPLGLVLALARPPRQPGGSTSRPRSQRPDWTATALYNPADFYDLFGPTKTSRKGYAFGLAHNRTFVYDPPRQYDLLVDATYWGDLETLPDYQNVTVPVSTLFSVTARLHGRNVRSSLGHVDDEKGIEWDTVLDQSLRRGQGRTFAAGPTSISASRCPCATRRCGCAARPASLPATPPSPTRTSTSAASATTGSTTATRSGTASSTPSPASR